MRYSQKRIPNFEFHFRNIRELKKDANYLKKIENFSISNPDYFYSRKDKSGWWMATKQIIIKKYIGAYLNILSHQEDLELYFIDLLSSWGMNRVTKQRGKDIYIFPGTSISAALISSKTNIGFKKFYINDLNPRMRKILTERFDALNSSLKSPLEVIIDARDIEIDSNNWVIDIMTEIMKNKSSSKINYLTVIDNQGMDIYYDTIRRLREINEYGDIIITFQDVGIGRQIKNKELITKFFGTKIDPDTKVKDLCQIYIKKLQKIGFGRIEPIKIETTSGFYYTLLFCCRAGTSASWLNMIEKYRDERFRKWTDDNVKKMWDIVGNKQKNIYQFLREKI